MEINSYISRNRRMLCIVISFFLISVICNIKYILGIANIFYSVNTDSFTQFFRFVPFLEKNIFKNIWSWSDGLGGDIFTDFSYYYTTSPFFYFQVIIDKILNIDIQNYNVMVFWKITISILRQFLSMCFMFFLLKSEHRRTYNSVIGALFYGTTIIFLRTAIRFDFFNDCYVWLPMSILAFRTYEKNGNCIPLALSIAVTVGNSFYFGFINCVFLGVYFIYFSFDNKIDKEYIVKIIKIIIICIIGIGISSIVFIPSIRALFMSDRIQITGNMSIVPVYKNIVDVYSKVFSIESLISLPIFIVAPFLAKKHIDDSLYNKKKYFFLFWIVLSQVPLISCFMNGMSYNSDRWFYLVEFSMAYFIPDFIENINKLQLKKCLLILLIAIILLIGIIYIKNCENKKWEIYNLILNVVFIQILILKKDFNKYGVLLIISLCLIFRGYSVVTTEPSEYIQDVLFGTEEEKIITSQLIPKQNEFYRVNDEIANSESDYRRYENKALNNGVYGISAYNSIGNGELSKWIKKIYNVRGVHVAPSYYRGFDDRYFLETAWGVKYKINYNFEKYKNIPTGYFINNNGILENKNNLGIDSWYETSIDEQEFDKFDYAYKDSILLQTAVIDEKNLKLKQPNIDDISRKVDIVNIKYINCENENGVITVDSNNKAEIEIPILNEYKNGEYLFSFNIDELNDKMFEIDINGKKMIKNSSNYQWSYPINYFTFKLNDDTKTIKFKLNTAGSYRISDLRLYFNSFDKVEDWCNSRNKYNIENLNFGKDTLSGTIKNNDRGILALSIPFSKGWSVKVDGLKVDTIKVNKIFTGLMLEPGEHILEFTYHTPLLSESIATSFTSLILLLLLKKKLSI